MSSQRFSFHRPELAVDLCNSLEGKGLTDASSGMFLAAPRRTGKSTFLRVDLIPEMQRRGWIAAYVDLWADQTRDPAVLIAEALRQTIAKEDGVISRTAKAAGLAKVRLATFEFDVEKVGRVGGTTLSEALDHLHQKSGKPVALVIDEAQQALNTEAGIKSMFAIKAARDKLNQEGDSVNLFLVFTGSHRDKLAHLVLKKDQPFFGSHVTTFPLLGKPFTDAYTLWVNPQLAETNQFNAQDMFEAFKLVGHRPEMLRSIVSEIALDYGAATNFGAMLQDGAQKFREKIWIDIESEFNALTALQKSVLSILAEKNKSYSPFTEEAMKAYRAYSGQQDLGTASVQAALEQLREKNLIWKSARGSYALEDESLAQWLKTQRSKP